MDDPRTGHQDSLVLGVPVDVEPGSPGGFATVAKHCPQPAVQALR